MFQGSGLAAPPPHPAPALADLIPHPTSNPHPRPLTLPFVYIGCVVGLWSLLPIHECHIMICFSSGPSEREFEPRA